MDNFSDDFFRLLYDNSPIPQAIIDVNGLKSCNKVALKFFGFSSCDELRAAGIPHLSPPKQPDGSDSIAKRREILRIAEQKGSVTFEWKFQLPDESTRFVELTLTSLASVQEGIFHLTGTDISRQAEAKKALEESESRFRNYIEHTPSIIMIYQNFKWVYVNPTVTRLLGYTPEEFYKMGLVDFIHPDDRDIIIERAKLRLSNDKTVPNDYDVRVITKDGRQLWGNIHAENIFLNGKRAMLLSAIDITDRKIAEEQTKKNEKNLIITLNAIADGVISTDTDGIIVRINPVAEQLTGKTRQEAIGKPLHSIFRIFSDQNKELDIITQFIAHHTTDTIPNNVILSSYTGTSYHINQSFAPIYADEGHLEGVVIVFRDITRQQMIEEQLRYSRRVAAVGDLASGIAHDFNNILGGILGAAEMLSLQTHKDAPEQQHISTIKNASVRARNITRQLLNISRKGKILSTTIDINELIRDSVELLEHSINKNITLHKQLTPDLPPVNGDSRQIQNAILTLVLNAGDAMPEGGTISLHTDVVELSEKDCRQFRDISCSPGTFVKIVVKDTAPQNPYPSDSFSSMFLRSRDIGYGPALALPSIYAIAKDHDGAVTTDYEEGKGATTSLFLPVSSNTNTAHQLTHTHDTNALILVVDDEDIICRVTVALLHEMGYRTMMAHDGKKGVELFRSSPAVSLVILDIVMPLFGGEQAFHELRKINPSLPILLTSGFPKDINISPLLKDRYTAFLQKPYNHKELSDAVSKLLAQ